MTPRIAQVVASLTTGGHGVAHVAQMAGITQQTARERIEHPGSWLLDEVEVLARSLGCDPLDLLF